MDEVTEDQCLICRRWPEAELANGRSQYFSTDATDRVLLIPVHDQPIATLPQECMSAMAPKADELTRMTPSGLPTHMHRRGRSRVTSAMHVNPMIAPTI